MRSGLALALLLASCGGGELPGAGGGASAKFGGASPWGTANAVYSRSAGILEQPVVGASTDEAQNLWVATRVALYLLKPGETTFRRFTVADGLHLQGNPVSYCDRDFAGGDRRCPITGAAANPGISEIEGGAPGEVFVGYFGIDDGTGEWDDPNRHTGKLDRVRLTSAGGLQINRMDLVASNSPQFWHNRTVQRLLYDHVRHPHELYVGSNHGVDRLWPDKYRAPAKGEWFLNAANEWMSDHLHPQVCFHHACDASESDLRLGDWKGMALSADGNLWVGGRWTGGQIRWTPDLDSWWNRPGNQIYSVAFGDPYKGPCGQGFCNQPVFMVPAEGDVVSVQAVAVTADGRAWFASGRTTTADAPRGLAAWDGKAFRYFDPQRDAGMAENDVRDMIALPDGRLVLAGANTGLVFWNPQTGVHTSLRAGAGLPDDHVFRIELDTMVSPPALYVATFAGAAALRKLP
ncbi:MAG TPA: WD40 repeat domain-containing protein [Myxococcales bacterium]|nr:WD40 repeat domain-containing protein [Myxococcales bacterium]